MIRIVIDVDDTICDNNGRDYINAIPYVDVINKINTLYREGYEIILYTSRGMKSCDGDLIKIKEKNELILIEWLRKYNVKYHELIFGKVLGDIYIDDKAMEVRDFVKAPFEKLKGGSNSDVVRLGHIVKKDLKTPEKTQQFKNWNKENTNLCLSPHVISYLYNGVYIDYIEGKLLSQYLSIESFLKLISIIFNFKNKKYTEFNLQYHLNNLNKNKSCKNINKRIEFCKKRLKSFENDLLKNASFSHGDCILSNIIEDSSSQLWFIDANMTKEASSYLLDLAKLRMSLDNYEHYFFNVKEQNSSYKNILDNILQSNNIYDIVVTLEYMHILRVYRYKEVNEQHYVFKMLETLEKEQKWTIN